MALKLYNTLTRQKTEFTPIDPKNVRMYVCGPTVYDFAHIGNARPVIVFDVLFRLLRHIYGADHVTYARNITDVDDKINARAAERYPELAPEIAIRKLTEETAAQFHKDISALGVLPPTVEPRATEHITEMVALCEALVERGHAYVAADHVLFDVASMPDYGRLSNRSLDEMEAGARVEVAPYKKGPMDFVLWKPSKPGEPAWPSPKGIAALGRPGWHIECSAMADRWLWDEPRLKGLMSEAGLARPHVFDIHGGGIDLAFPHHENEIAQSRCAHGTPVMANVWMHNGFLQVEGEKMSKSLGNFITINELLHRWLGPVVRHLMLMTHYRQPIDWTIDGCGKAREELRGWALASDPDKLPRSSSGEPWAECEESLPGVVDALSDDLNTPSVISILRDHYANERKWSILDRKLFVGSLKCMGYLRPTWVRPLQGGVVGEGLPREIAEKALKIAQDLNVHSANALSVAVKAGQKALNELNVSYTIDNLGEVSIRYLGEVADDETIEGSIAARLAARKAKDFKRSDEIRDELAKIGIALKDSKNKDTGEIETTWEVIR